MWLTYANNVGFDLSLAAVYLIAAYFCRRDVWPCLLASLSCQIYCITPLYTFTVETAPAMVFVVCSAIYFTVIKSLKNYITMIACLIMAVFELIMYGAYNDWFSPQGVNDWLYQNYELLVACVHAYIVCTLVRWGYVRRCAGLFRDGILRHFSGNCLPLYF